jgi:hypothetical protein
LGFILAALTRRGLLQAGGVAGFAALAGGRPWAPASASAATRPSPLARSTYTGITGTAFQVGTQTLELVGVADLPSAATDRKLAGSEDAFSLLFTGPAGNPLKQGVQAFSHPQVGNFELFIVPVEMTTGLQRYEVVVNSWAPPKPPKPAPPHQPTKDVQNPSKHAHKPALRRVSARRLGRGLACKLTLGPETHVAVVAAWLMRGDRVYASASVRHVRGRERVSLTLPSAHRLRNGPYHLVVLTEDHKGRQEYKRQALKLG